MKQFLLSSIIKFASLIKIADDGNVIEINRLLTEASKYRDDIKNLIDKSKEVDKEGKIRNINKKDVLSSQSMIYLNALDNASTKLVDSLNDFIQSIKSVTDNLELSELVTKPINSLSEINDTLSKIGIHDVELFEKMPSIIPFSVDRLKNAYIEFMDLNTKENVVNEEDSDRKRREVGKKHFTQMLLAFFDNAKRHEISAKTNYTRKLKETKLIEEGKENKILTEEDDAESISNQIIKTMVPVKGLNPDVVKRIKELAKINKSNDKELDKNYAFIKDILKSYKSNDQNKNDEEPKYYNYYRAIGHLVKAYEDVERKRNNPDSIYALVDDVGRQFLDKRVEALIEPWRNPFIAETTKKLESVFDIKTPIVKFLTSNNQTINFDENIKNIGELISSINLSKVEFSSESEANRIVVNLEQFSEQFPVISSLMKDIIVIICGEIRHGKSDSSNSLKGQKLELLSQKMHSIKRTRDSLKRLLKLSFLNTTKEIPAGATKEEIKQIKEYNTNSKTIRNNINNNITELPIFDKINELQHYFTDSIDKTIKNRIFGLNPIKILTIGVDNPDSKLIPKAIDEAEILLKSVDEIISYIRNKAKEDGKDGANAAEIILCKDEVESFDFPPKPGSTTRPSMFLSRLDKMKKAFIATITQLSIQGKALGIPEVENYELTPERIASKISVNKERDSKLYKEFGDELNKSLGNGKTIYSLIATQKSENKSFYDYKTDFIRNPDFVEMLNISFYRDQINDLIKKGDSIYESILESSYKADIKKDLDILKHIVSKFDSEQKPYLDERARYQKIRDNQEEPRVKVPGIQQTNDTRSKKEKSDTELLHQIDVFMNTSINDHYSLLDLITADTAGNTKLIDTILSGTTKYGSSKDMVAQLLPAMYEIISQLKHEELKAGASNAPNRISEILSEYSDRKQGIIKSEPIQPEPIQPEPIQPEPIIETVQPEPEPIIELEKVVPEPITDIVKPVEIVSPGKEPTDDVRKDLEEIKREVISSPTLSKANKKHVLDKINTMSVEDARRLVNNLYAEQEDSKKEESAPTPGLTRESINKRIESLPLKPLDKTKLIDSLGKISLKDADKQLKMYEESFSDAAGKLKHKDKDAVEYRDEGSRKKKPKLW
jgi:hypothetical protein